MQAGQVDNPVHLPSEPLGAALLVKETPGVDSFSCAFEALILVVRPGAQMFLRQRKAMRLTRP